MKVVISSGHGLKIRGARGNPVPPQLDERDENVRLANRVAEVLRSIGVGTVVFHDDVSTSQGENLDRIVDFHNAQTRDLDVSIHFNAYDHSAHGCEVLYASSKGETYAKKIVDAICDVTGLTNRGAKHRGDLAFLNNTECTAVLIEACFCDNTSDSNIYHSKFEEIATAIAVAISGQEGVQPGPTPPPEVERPPTRPPPTQPPAQLVRGEPTRQRRPGR